MALQGGTARSTPARRGQHLDYGSLPVDAALMLAHTIADDAVQASARGVDGPIQLAVVDASRAGVLEEAALKPVRDTAAPFRIHQGDFLVREPGAEAEGGDSEGLVPG